MMVPQESAVLRWPNETTHPCDADHSKIAKLSRSSSTTYDVLANFIIGSMIYFMKETTSGLDKMYSRLATSNCEANASRPDLFQIQDLCRKS